MVFDNATPSSKQRSKLNCLYSASVQRFVSVFPRFPIGGSNTCFWLRSRTIARGDQFLAQELFLSSSEASPFPRKAAKGSGRKTGTVP